MVIEESSERTEPLAAILTREAAREWNGDVGILRQASGRTWFTRVSGKRVEETRIVSSRKCVSPGHAQGPDFPEMMSFVAVQNLYRWVQLGTIGFKNVKRI